MEREPSEAQKNVVQSERRTGERYWNLERIVELVKQVKEQGGTLVQVNEVRIELAPPLPPGFVQVMPANDVEVKGSEGLLRQYGMLPNLADQLQRQIEKPQEEVDDDRFSAG